MSDTDKFHKIALHSILFKGQHDWYYCYLKSEKIAHVLLVLAGSNNMEGIKGLAQMAEALPGRLVYFVAGEERGEVILADIFSLISALRLAATQGSISKENASVLVQEYEDMAGMLATGSHPSPFVKADDFMVPHIEKLQTRLLSKTADFEGPPSVKDIYKGQIRIKDNIKDNSVSVERTSLILEVVRKNNGISIKGISAVVKDCSEKTIQRELVTLINRGLIRKQGERRWSIYSAV